MRPPHKSKYNQLNPDTQSLSPPIPRCHITPPPSPRVAPYGEEAKPDRREPGIRKGLRSERKKRKDGTKGSGVGEKNELHGKEGDGEEGEGRGGGEREGGTGLTPPLALCPCHPFPP